MSDQKVNELIEGIDYTIEDAGYVGIADINPPKEIEIFFDGNFGNTEPDSVLEIKKLEEEG